MNTNSDLTDYDPAKTTIVFTDGACSGNPGPGGWGAVIATPQGDVLELGGGARETTNNIMELMGSLEALKAVASNKIAVPPGPLWLHTDSTYVIRGITGWIWKWKKNGWVTGKGEAVLNKPVWQELAAAVSLIKKNHPIVWRYVRGHAGVPGNERCDRIAVDFAAGRRPTLYRGSLLQYDIAILDIPEDGSLPQQRANTGDKAQPHGYLSLVEGVPKRHTTWAECERRVKGQPGAKCKKVMTPADEKPVLEAWGYDFVDLED